MEFNRMCGFERRGDLLKKMAFYSLLDNRDIIDIDINTRIENYLNIDIDKILTELEKEKSHMMKMSIKKMRINGKTDGEKNLC